MSTHAVRIIEIENVKPHENAERLEIVHIGGWSCVVAKGQFEPGSRAVYIEPDYVVPLDRPEFAFLKKPGSDKTEHRLKAIRLRGVISFGLLIPVPEPQANRPTGTDVMEELGIRRYEPPVKHPAGGLDDGLPEDQWPQVYASKFDVDDLRKHEHLFREGEEVWVTEKIHGGNMRAVFHNGVLYVGSRGRWLKPDVPNHWTRALANTPQIEAWCRAHESTILYGEVYGPVQELKYGLREPMFAAFAAAGMGEYFSLSTLYDSLAQWSVPRAPLLYKGPYDRALIATLGEQDSHIESAPAGHMMEGVVIAPAIERRDDTIGRVALKLISNRYWLS
jgi:RNA ligase (TIGR02306 family)